MNNVAMTRQRQQHYLFGSEIGSPGPVKQESHARWSFFDDWPKGRDSWSELDDQRYDKNTFSTTQLSISVPMPSSEISSRSACSPNGELTLNQTAFANPI
ncbi:Growth-regulating factor 4 [Camellia lanceoleosa]|uniref:Growth-regulating factor 4 n=1 Tax=Camellia lanceoleosa TaxID=1840588 RepID=A0ACC0FZX0_9ERIC|nr:Growth-regulating factor 4 [Camellia lanceoleosa]